MSYLSLLAEITAPTESPWTIVKNLDTYGPLGAFVALVVIAFLGWKYVGKEILKDVLATTTNLTTITINLKDISRSQDETAKANTLATSNLVVLQSEMSKSLVHLENILVRQAQEKPCQTNSLYSPPNHQPPTPNPSTTSLSR